MSRAFGVREDGGVRFRRVSQAFCLGYDVAALQAAGAGVPVVVRPTCACQHRRAR